MTKKEAKEIILRHQFLFSSMPDEVLLAIDYLMKDKCNGTSEDTEISEVNK